MYLPLMSRSCNGHRYVNKLPQNVPSAMTELCLKHTSSPEEKWLTVFTGRERGKEFLLGNTGYAEI